MFPILSLLYMALVASTAVAQLTGSVGPTMTTTSKRSTACNVLDYGGEIGSSDIGPAILSAFNECVKTSSASTLYIPPGNYSMATWVTLNKGSHWALQLDGIITRTSNTGGHMFLIENANDFEFFSSTSTGAIQGNGYECRNNGPRLARIVTSTNWSLHDLIFVDSPEFHLIVQGGSNGEVYNLAIRGANIGGSDGVDISGDNHWVHDVEVTNSDECVTVKSPAFNFLIERIWCNQSGGSAIGSLSTNTSVENIVYRNIYTNGGNQMLMIKSNYGSGYVKNALFENFIGTGAAYTLDINQYWVEETAGEGDGVELSGLVFKDWNGVVPNGVNRPHNFICADGTPCNNITLDNVNLWSSTGEAVQRCGSAYGTGACLIDGDATTSYATATTSYSRPSGYTVPTTMSGDLVSGFATNSPIPIPTIPTAYFPGLLQISPLAKNLKSTASSSFTVSTVIHTSSSSSSKVSTSSKFSTVAVISKTSTSLVPTITSSTKASTVKSSMRSSKILTSESSATLGFSFINQTSSKFLTVYKASSTVSSSVKVSSTGTVAHYSQCGGQGYTGATECITPYTCVTENAYYSQCL